MKPKFLNLILMALSIRESVANSSPAASMDAREFDIANSLDPSEAIDFSDTADGWFKISPYGVFRGRNPGRPQHISIENAKLMESEFNSLFGKLGRKFRGVPIYHGHPDVDPELWPDDRRIGKLTKLEARPDGLWGFAEWNSIGEENKREGWWIYPSPRWDMAPGKDRFAPDRLISIGLTNTPRIAESDPVFNSATPDKQETETTTKMDPKLIREKLGLRPESTDEEVMAKLDAVVVAATNAGAQATDLENARTAMATEKAAKEELANSLVTKNGEIATLRAAHNKAVLDLAQAEGRITPAERPAWESRLVGPDRESEINSLAAKKSVLNTKRLDVGDRREERTTADNLREEVANSVAKLQKEQGLSYNAAWKQVKKDPQYKAYFERVEA